VDNLRFVVAGYALTIMALSGYVARLLWRARGARLRATAISQRRRSAPG
jgi:Flp pilus assembly protein CpaB